MRLQFVIFQFLRNCGLSAALASAICKATHIAGEVVCVINCIRRYEILNCESLASQVECQ